MKLKSIIGFGFGGITLVGAVTASALYLPQVQVGENFYGTQLIDNDVVYSKINLSQPNGVSVFESNGNLGKFVGGTPNVSLDVLLNGTNDYSNGNYIVLFASDGDPLSNLFLYGNAYRLNAKDGGETIDYHKFGFSIDEKTSLPKFESNSVVANFGNGYIQSAFQYITNKKALNIMSVLPSVVLIHDKINYEVIQSLISYQNYVKSCFHDVVIKSNGKYSFAPNTKNYEQFAKNNPKLAPNYETSDSLQLFEGLVGYDKDMKDTDKHYANNQKLKEEAEKLNSEYKWAKDLKVNDPVCFGFQFNPINSSFEPNTYIDPAGNSKPYRTDIGAKKYVESIQKFKNKLSPSFILTTFTDQTNGGHYIGFAHSQSKQESVVLNDDLAAIPKKSDGNEDTNLNQFGGKSANSKFCASLVSLYNGVSNPVFGGNSLLDKYINNNPSTFSNVALISSSDKKATLLKNWYILK